MKTSFIKYGRNKGRDLCEISLENNCGMQVKVLNYGATLEQVLLNGENMILSLKTPVDYSKERNFLGGTVGRIAGRMRRGIWKHGSEMHQFPLNDEKNHIHGGSGIDTEVWNFKPICTSDKASVELSLFDPANHNDYPGNLKIKARYELDNDNTLHYMLQAVSDQLTVFNPVNHTYFNLGERAEDLDLQINADYYLPVDEEGLPTCGMEKVAGTAFDFRKKTLIKKALNSNDPQIKQRGGLDHPLILNGNRPAAILSSSRHRLIVNTNAPALVLYTGNHFNHTGVADNIGKYDGITFEAQFPPAEGSDLGEITLLPFEKFNRMVTWKFE